MTTKFLDHCSYQLSHWAAAGRARGSSSCSKPQHVNCGGGESQGESPGTEPAVLSPPFLLSSTSFHPPPSLPFPSRSSLPPPFPPSLPPSSHPPPLPLHAANGAIELAVFAPNSLKCGEAHALHCVCAGTHNTCAQSTTGTLWAARHSTVCGQHLKCDVRVPTTDVHYSCTGLVMCACVSMATGQACTYSHMPGVGQ